MQWRNRQRESAPQRLLTVKFLLTYHERERQGKKRKWSRKERKKKKKRKVENCKWKEEKLQNEERILFFCFCLFVCLLCFLFFLFSFACHFSKILKFVLGLPKWEFSTGKKHFTPGKIQEK